MYCFHASLPDSRPPPVSFSPPNAPPISAQLVPMFTLAMPQSLPRALRKVSAVINLVVKLLELDQIKDRSEDLFLENRHPGMRLHQCWLDEATAELAAAGQHFP